MTEGKLTAADLASGLSRRASLPMRYSEEFVRSFFSVIADGLTRDNMVKVKGFGTFKLIGIEARESINVNTGERIEIAGHTKVSFTPDPVLRDAVNKPFVEFDTVILNDGADTALMEAVDEEVLNDSLAATPAAKSEESTEKIAQLVKQPVQDEAVNEKPAQEEAIIQEPVQEDEDEMEDVEDEVLNEPEEDNNEEPAQEERVMNEQFDMPENNNSGHSALWMILVALLFTAIGYCLGYYWHPIALPELSCEQTENVDQNDAATTPASQPAVAPTATEENQPADSTAVPADSTEAAVPASTSTAAADYPQLEGGEYVIVGVLANDTMKVGKMLSKMAIQYYGDKDLYKYICTMNNIENPDVVPLNMPLLIPKLEKKQE